MTESADYRRVFSHNIRVADAHFILLARHSQQTLARLGLAVAKKHLKRASDRNTVKRLIRESFRAQQGALPNLDVVVLIKRGIDSRDKQSLRQGLDRLWQKLRKQPERSQCG